MAEKISTLILKVDLECCRCYKKIKKVMCKLQDRERIQTIKYDEKNNTVTISGPFDPQRLKRILLCKTCNVIKDIEIPKPPPPPETPKPKPKPNPSPPPPPPPTKVVVCPYPVWPLCCRHPCPCPCPCPCGGRGGRRCCTCGKEDTECAPPRSCIPPPGYSHGGGGGGGGPWRDGCIPPPRPWCDGGGYKIVCEEDPQCTIM